MQRVARTAFPLVGSLVFLLWAFPGETDAARDQDASPVLGSGIFGPPQTVTPSPHTPGDGGPTSILLADVDRDHDLDLVVANTDSNLVSVFRRRANGAFSSADSYQTGNGPVSLAVGDVNHDTNPDLVVGSCRRDTTEWGVHVLLGMGDGTFDDAYRVDYWLNWYGLCSIALGDVNRDANLDITVAAGTLRVLLGNGDGTFEVDAEYGSLNDGSQSVVMGDLSGDGNPDLVVANDSRNTISVFLGHVDGDFDKLEEYPTWGRPYSVALGDVNGDEKIDIAVVCSARVLVFRGTGYGTFNPPDTLVLGWEARSVALGDLDADSHIDLVVGDAYGDSVSVLRGNGDGTFQSAENYSAGGGSVCVALGDLDGDWALDLAVVSERDSSLSLMHNYLGPFDDDAPTLSLGILQNPYLTEHLDIYLVASEPLDPDLLEFRIAGYPQSPRLVQPWDHLWMANYRLTSSSGSVLILVDAYDRSGNHGGAIAQFGARLLLAGSGGSLTSPNGHAWISFPPDALARDAFILIMAQSSVSREWAALGELPGLLGQQSGGPTDADTLVYHISPSGILRGKEATLTLSYAPEALPPGVSPDGLYIERVGEGPLESFLDRDRHTITAQVADLGTFRLNHGQPGANTPMDPGFLRVDASTAGLTSGAAVLRFESHAASKIRVSVYDVAGREVARLLDGTVGPGVHRLEWSGLASSGHPAASGMYFFRVETERRAACRRLLVLR